MSRHKFDSAKRASQWRRDQEEKYSLYDIKYRNEQNDKIKEAEKQKYDNVSKIIANELIRRENITANSYLSFYPIVKEIIDSSAILSKREYTQEDIEKITLRVLKRYNLIKRKQEDIEK